MYNENLIENNKKLQSIFNTILEKIASESSSENNYVLNNKNYTDILAENNNNLRSILNIISVKTSAPSIRINAGRLIIVTAEAEELDIFIDEVKIDTISVAPSTFTTTYVLPYLTSGSYNIAVIAKVTGKLDSTKVTINYNVTKLKPSLSIEGVTLVSDVGRRFDIFVDNVLIEAEYYTNRYELTNKMTPGTHIIGIVAKEDGYENSDMTSITYTRGQPSSKVIAEFNNDFTSVIIKINTEYSEAETLYSSRVFALSSNNSTIMKDYDYSNNISPMSNRSNSLVSVIVEPGVTTIGAEAFYKCNKINNVILPEGLTSQR